MVLTETDRYVYAPGQQAEVTVRTLDYDSNPVSAKVNLEFERHRSWALNEPGDSLSRAALFPLMSMAWRHYTYTVPKVPWLTVDASAADQNQRQATFSSNLWISEVEGVAEASRGPPH